MALLMNEAHTLSYHKDAVRSKLLGYSYFFSSDYLAVKAQVWVIFLFMGMVGYIFDGFPCHLIVAVFDLLDYLVVPVFHAL